jgi:hypothetical protein
LEAREMNGLQRKVSPGAESLIVHTYMSALYILRRSMALYSTERKRGEKEIERKKRERRKKKIMEC